MPARFSRSSTSLSRCTSAFAAATDFSRSAIALLSCASAAFGERVQAPQSSASAATEHANERERRAMDVFIATSSASADRILVVERRHAHAGVRLARLARRPIRLDALAERVVLERLLRRVEPAPLVRCDERRVPVQLADLPNA